MAITGPDISHHQTSADFAAVARAGHQFVALKVTESTNYVDPTFSARRAAAHAAGLVVGLYHFARAGNAAGEAAWFLKQLGQVQRGEFLVLDWEVPAADPVGWCRAWLEAVRAATGIRALIYMNSTAERGSNWSPLIADYGLWLAKYDGSQAQTAVTHWSALAMKQYTDKGTVPGVPGPCDVNVFYGTTDQLRAYGAGGDDMPTAKEIVDELMNRPIDFTYRDPATGAGKPSSTSVRQLLADLYAQTFWGMGSVDWGPGLALQLRDLVAAAHSGAAIDPAAIQAAARAGAEEAIAQGVDVNVNVGGSKPASS
jgi:GH25 family lysozyme M1 (1,4-beta-N-acetylmuramidase)